MSERHHRALHSPLASMTMVGLQRYREAIGDVVTRLLVARYRGVLEGAPLWHVVVQIVVPEGPMRLRAEWTRRDRRRAVQIAEGLLAHHGEGELLDGDAIEGLSGEVALHRLKRVTLAEMSHFPEGYIERPSIDLKARDERGADLEGAMGEGADDRVSVPPDGMGAFAVRAPDWAASGAEVDA